MRGRANVSHRAPIRLAIPSRSAPTHSSWVPIVHLRDDDVPPFDVSAPSVQTYSDHERAMSCMTYSAGARSDPVSTRSQIGAIPQEAHSLGPDDCAMHDDATDHDHHDHGDGLHEDLVKLATRRDALRIFGAGSAAAILATLGASTAERAGTPTGEVPTETAGPYPGDGSNGPDVLEDSGIVRHDMRRSFGSSRTLAKG